MNSFDMFLLVLKALERALEISNIKFIPPDKKYFNILQQWPESDNTLVSPYFNIAQSQLSLISGKKIMGRECKSLRINASIFECGYFK